MANRRMFTLKIVDTDAFLDMPQSSQLLYFHLSMRADDDGFVSNPKKIMRMIGSQEDDYKVLLSKRFLIPFESGVCAIKHWRMHNLIRKDRYNETTYLEEKSKLSIKQNGSYSIGKPNVIPIGNQTQPQVRLGKVRLGKDKETLTHKTIKYLTNIPQEDINLFTSKFNCNNNQVISKGDDLLNYCKAKGRQYKDYKAFLRNALKNDYGERSSKNGKYENL